MATKKTATGDTKTAAPAAKPMRAPKKATKKIAKAKPIKVYETLRALKTAKSKRTAPKGITVAIVGDDLVFSAKGTDILTIYVVSFVEDMLKSEGFKPT